MKHKKTPENKIFFLLLLVSVFMIFTCNVYADTILKEGDCVVFGKIHGEEITWRVYDKTEDNVILISDKALEKMAYDADLSFWDTADIRVWLNSQTGFLNPENFTESEMGLLGLYSQRSLANKLNLGTDYEGSEEHIYNGSVHNVLQNYNLAYSMYAADYVFLPSVADVNKLARDIYTFGVDYEMTESISEPGTYCPYWLSDSMYGFDKAVTRCITGDGFAGYANSYDASIGVRPMCSLISRKVGIISGDGSESTPYILGDNDYLALYTKNSSVWAGTLAEITVYGKGTESASVILYRNNELISSEASGTVNVEINRGVNVFTAYVYDGNGKPVLISKPCTIYGYGSELIKNKCDLNFDDENPFNTVNGTLVWSEDKGKSGKGIGLISTPKTHASVSTVSFDKTKEQVFIDVDLRFDSFGVITNQPFRFKVMPSNEFIIPVSIDTGGNVSLKGVIEILGNLIKLEEDRWYNFKIVINDKAGALTLAVDNVVLCSDVKIGSDFTYTSYMILSSSWNNTEEDNGVSFDNLKIYTAKSPGESVRVMHILHPDKKAFTTLCLNDSPLRKNGYLIGAFYYGNLLKEHHSKILELLPYKGDVANFNFTMSDSPGGYFRTFAFGENLRPLDYN